MPIPALFHHSVEEEVITTGEGFKLLSFDKKPFVLPETHRYGKCRPVTEFDKICQIGEGAYGTVFKAQDRRSNDVVALKRLKMEYDGDCIPLYYAREIKIMNSLKHDNVMSLLGVAAGKNQESTYLILEFCPYSLANIVDDVEGSLLQQPQIKCIMHQLFTGLDYLHTHFIIHRDVNLTNILFTHSGLLKVADFGCSRIIFQDNMTPNVVSLWYRPPEILFGSNRYSFPVDMWSAGCVLAELLHKVPIFRGKSEACMIGLIMDCLGSPTEENWPGYSELPLPQLYHFEKQPVNKLKKYFEDQPDICVDLLQKLLLYYPKARHTAIQCLQHNYFTEDPPACSISEFMESLGISKS